MMLKIQHDWNITFTSDHVHYLIILSFSEKDCDSDHCAQDLGLSRDFFPPLFVSFAACFGTTFFFFIDFYVFK